MTQENKGGLDADKVLRLGQKIHLTADLGVNEAGEPRILDVRGVIRDIALRYVAVEPDITTREYLSAPPVGTELKCDVVGDGCVYRFAASFRSSSALPEKLWRVDKPEMVERVQMRRFVRVPMSVPMQVKLEGSHGSLKNARETTLVDISGGGLCFTSDDAVPLHSRIAVDIPNLPLYGSLKADATVERCLEIETNTSKVYHIGASLENSLSAREQDKLIQSVFELQRGYLKKGLRMPNVDHTKRNKK